MVATTILTAQTTFRDPQKGTAFYWTKYWCDSIFLYETSVFTFKWPTVSQITDA